MKKMKKYLTLALVLPAMLALMSTAHADVIAAAPGDIALSLVLEFMPWILVGAAVGVTVFLLRKFWKRRK